VPEILTTSLLRSWQRIPLAVVLALAVGLLLGSPPCLGAVSVSRLAIFPFLNADIPSDDPESIAGLGTMLASRLATLFAQECPGIRVVSQTVIDEVIRQQGMSDMGLLDPSRIPEIGGIADADHFWTGTYRRSGASISVDAILWSVEEAAAVGAIDVHLRWFFPGRAGHVEALACEVFSDMYREIFSLPAPTECPAPSLLGELVAVVKAGIGSVKMSSLNNVIRQANTVNGIQMAELNWMPSVCGSIGYVVIPDLFTAFAEIEYLGASRHAGSSANVSLECSALIPKLALEWQIAAPWETDAQLFVRGAVGWASAKMEKRDVSGLLNCPARVLGSGLSYDLSAGVGFILGDSMKVQIEGSYKGCRVSTTSVRLPTLDFSGVRAQISFLMTFGGRN
jgi:hypothetical protein